MLCFLYLSRFGYLPPTISPPQKHEAISISPESHPDWYYSTTLLPLYNCKSGPYLSATVTSQAGQCQPCLASGLVRRSFATEVYMDANPHEIMGIYYRLGIHYKDMYLRMLNKMISVLGRYCNWVYLLPPQSDPQIIPSTKVRISNIEVKGNIT